VHETHLVVTFIARNVADQVRQVYITLVVLTAGSLLCRTCHFFLALDVAITDTHVWRSFHKYVSKWRHCVNFQNV